LKLYVYGYLNRVQSSRRLEREAARNVEVMWLTGRLVPDHKTIADFRKNWVRNWLARSWPPASVDGSPQPYC
jgi:transposase